MKDFAVVTVADDRHSDLDVEILISDIIDNRIDLLFASIDPSQH